MALPRTLLLIGLLTALAAAGCMSSGPQPHRNLQGVWKRFVTLPDERAMAIAGDPRRGRWVSGASGGHATRSDAEQEALSQCGIRRAARRMRAKCIIYAVGNEIVWSGP